MRLVLLGDRPSLVSFVARPCPSIHPHIYIYAPISCPSVLFFPLLRFLRLYSLSPHLSSSLLLSFFLPPRRYFLFLLRSCVLSFVFPLSLCRFPKCPACIVISWRVSVSSVFLNFIGQPGSKKGAKTRPSFSACTSCDCSYARKQKRERKRESAFSYCSFEQGQKADVKILLIFF